MGRGQVIALKGRGGFDRIAPVDGPSYVDVTEGGRKISRGVALWNVAVSVFKLETYRYFRLNVPTDEDLALGKAYSDGFIHVGQGVSTEWFKQITAEQLVQRKNKRTGFAKSEWVKTRERNEALDCRVYARAVAWLLGIDRWDESRWQDLEAQLKQAQQSAPEPAGQPRRQRRSRKAKQNTWFGKQQRNWFK
ncbi:Phage terminase large subunit (GpA) [Pseudovibrio sp. Ad13]|uniref:terminase gpA endonuclease subunit n=1 Tax=Pseudovibrio sp. Ad13 TaxID=989396 RepID=UPI0007B21199|nr:terminase gpA endonuclease subunit [Pseudovibrio sp. Ad13]KZK84885.1 Phage terminase large subunit (GpA) [Pseudovibrio sp. Ad13]